jgi:hypothetical protein
MQLNTYHSTLCLYKTKIIDKKVEINFSLGKCKTKATYSAKLRQKGKLDLTKIAQKFTVLMETPILLVIEAREIEVIVHSYGELLFKKCEDVKLMEKIAKDIYSTGLAT